MAESRLRSILARLEAMTQDKTGNKQVRRFETDGQLRATVTYYQDRGIFVLEDPNMDEPMNFDHIDYLAVEILELTQAVLDGTDTDEV